MFKNVLFYGVAAIVLVGSAAAIAQNTANFMAQGGNLWVIGGNAEIRSGGRQSVETGGQFDVESGGEINVEAGGSLKVAGIDLTVELALLTAASATLTDLASLTATVPELNKHADDSSRIVPVSEIVNFDCAIHGSGKISYVSSSSANLAGKLPPATGSGCIFEIYWQNAPSGTDVISVTGDDEFEGTLFLMSDDVNRPVKSFSADSGEDKDQLSFNNTTKFMATAGGHIRVIDIFPDTWTINGQGTATGSEADPFDVGQVP